jgi:hypothetical protein
MGSLAAAASQKQSHLTAVAVMVTINHVVHHLINFYDNRNFY